MGGNAVNTRQGYCGSRPSVLKPRGGQIVCVGRRLREGPASACQSHTRDAKTERHHCSKGGPSPVRLLCKKERVVMMRGRRREQPPRPRHLQGQLDRQLRPDTGGLGLRHAGNGSARPLSNEPSGKRLPLLGRRPEFERLGGVLGCPCGKPNHQASVRLRASEIAVAESRPATSHAEISTHLNSPSGRRPPQPDQVRGDLETTLQGNSGVGRPRTGLTATAKGQ